MSIQVFAEVIEDYETAIRWAIKTIGRPPRDARWDALDYDKACYYNYLSCRLHDSETRKPINDKVYGIPWDERKHE